MKKSLNKLITLSFVLFSSYAIAGGVGILLVPDKTQGQGTSETE